MSAGGTSVACEQVVQEECFDLGVLFFGCLVRDVNVEVRYLDVEVQILKIDDAVVGVRYARAWIRRW